MWIDAVFEWMDKEMDGWMLQMFPLFFSLKNTQAVKKKNFKREEKQTQKRPKAVTSDYQCCFEML